MFFKKVLLRALFVGFLASVAQVPLCAALNNNNTGVSSPWLLRGAVAAGALAIGAGLHVIRKAVIVKRECWDLDELCKILAEEKQRIDEICQRKQSVDVFWTACNTSGVTERAIFRREFMSRVGVSSYMAKDKALEQAEKKYGAGKHAMFSKYVFSLEVRDARKRQSAIDSALSENKGLFEDMDQALLNCKRGIEKNHYTWLNKYLFD